MLAGKGINVSKIKDAGKCSVDVISLHQLERLLLGKATFGELKQLGKLPNDLFKGNACEPAGMALQTQPLTEGNVANESAISNTTAVT